MSRAELRAARPDPVYRCSAAARWLPPALAFAVLAATLLAVPEIEAGAGLLAKYLRPLLGVAGALAGLAIVRAAADVRHAFRLTEEALVVEAGSRSRRLCLADIERIDYAAPFASALRWLPATILVDASGKVWRVPALLDHGDRFVVELLRRARRNDLDAWAGARLVASRMRRARLRTAVGYGVVAAILAAGLGRGLAG